MNTRLINLAANCGIDASSMSLSQLKQAYKEQAAQFGPFGDQHLMRLGEALGML